MSVATEKEHCIKKRKERLERDIEGVDAWKNTETRNVYSCKIRCVKVVIFYWVV